MKYDFMFKIEKADGINFAFKYEANIKGDKIDLNSCKLLFKNDNKYIPAENILPKQESTLENEGYQDMSNRVNQLRTIQSIQPLTPNGNGYDRIGYY